MRLPLLLSVFLVTLSFWSSSPCAGFDGEPEVPVLVQNADAICVVKVVAITNVTPTQFEAVHKGRNGMPVFIDAQSAVAEATVQNVLAGKIGRKSIHISFFKNVRHGFNPSPFTELAAGETDIVFLKATTDDAHFALSQPTSHGKSKITIGDAKIGLLPPTASPLRTVLLVLVDALNGGSKPVELECLNRIGSAGYLLYAKAGVYVDEGAIARRLKIGEPLLSDNATSSLESFVNDQILPSVLKMTTDKDDKICEQAFLTAGYLQDVKVIPELVKIANANSKPGEYEEAAEILGQYRNPEAVRPLVNALSSKNSYVRQKAADALRNFADPLAVPFLLDHLDDPDSPADPFPGAQYYVVTALYTATNTPGYPGTTLFHDNPGEYIAFWKKWAAEHRDKIKALRAQFNAPAPVPAAP
jgi:hypothetical protein